LTSRAVSSASSTSDRNEIPTSAPSRAKAIATALPMPPSAPVMSARLLPKARSPGKPLRHGLGEATLTLSGREASVYLPSRAALGTIL
jgi:hypothetical protein